MASDDKTGSGFENFEVEDIEDIPVQKPNHYKAEFGRSCSTNMPYSVRDPEVWRDVVRYQFLYSLAGLVLGLVCIIGGIILFLRGVTGSTSWTAKALGLESNITDAAPGAVLFIVGLFLVFVTRFVVKAKR